MTSEPKIIASAKISAAQGSAISSSSADKESAKPTSLLWTPLLAIAFAAFAVEIPFFFFGTPSGHDVEFHLYSWLEVLSQWKEGVLYPRWASMANFGYGEPRFIFYPPASWTLGSIVSAIVPWRLASPVYIWIALVLAGASMFVLSRRWLDRRDAIFAAVLYAVNPYHLVIVYWRSAFAELLASCLLPLLLLLLLKAADGERRILIPLSLILAAAWLTNAPAAVMIHYSLALLVLVLALQLRSPKLVWLAAGAVALGACLAAFYLLPAIYEQKWVTIGEAISAGSRPQDNFLFIHTSDADHDAFNRMVSWIALLEIAVTLTAMWAARKWTRMRPAARHAVFTWAVACTLLMFPVTALLWKFLPKLEFMQFPWRWLLCLSLLFSLFVTIALRRWWMRGSVCAVAIILIVLAWTRVQAPWWDNAGDLKEMQDNMTDQIGYEGTDEYTPVGTDPSAVDKDARKVTGDGTARAAIRVHQWNAEARSFSADVSNSGRMALKLFPYPAWKVSDNGQAVHTEAREGTGQMLVPVDAGGNEVQIKFARTWDRTLGDCITLAGVIFVLFLKFRREQT
ncbi:MAG TPA: 6-pyruvoyl-tetrahydropterin synthase-related protein [Candidatus Sulfotelmatobacter sp.]|nr:6-pyruvoyl-tetrahydropterin synthase-related protein [Candidatus Sulfotelmatobacter sp.]